ncbi:MAG: TonB-dependent receptor [Flavobacteriaceae bacterium]|nr:TonB-dependent receptor [Flavobacteriaceae bacterium]
MKLNKITIILTTIVISIGCFSQNSSIEGNIKQIDSINVLSGISVYLDKTNFGTVTKGNGSYFIENIPIGNYTLIVSGIGHFTIKKEILVEENKILVENFILKETIASLPEVTITGGRVGIKSIPGSVHYISPKELQKFGYTDINRTLNTVPGVNIQEEDGFGLFPSIGLRGTGVERNTKITVMEDGVLMAPAPYTAPAAYYFPTMGRLQGIEIIKGSSQIQYGPYTTGGAINLISTQIPNEFSGKISVFGGSFGTKNLHAVIGNSHKNFSYMIETFQSSSDGFKELDGVGGRGFDADIGFNKQDYLAKFSVHTDEEAIIQQSLTFKIGSAIGDINETYLGLTQEDFNDNPIRRYAGSQVDNIKTSQNQFSLGHNIRFSEQFNITTTAYRTTFARNWYKLDRVRSNGTTRKISKILDKPIDYSDVYAIVTGANTDTAFDEALLVKANNRTYYSQGLQTKLKFNFKTENFKHKVELGLRIHEDQIDRFQWFDEYAMDNTVMQLTNAGIHGTESNRVETANAIATYLHYKLKIGKFTTTSGVRYENITQKRIDYGNADPNRIGLDISKRENTVTVFIPGIGFDYRFNKFVSIFAGIHKGFAPPGSKDELEPEESINYELGTRYSKNGLSGQAVLFFNDYTNLLGADLEASGGDGTNEQFNGGAVQTKGLEFNVTYDLLFYKEESPFNLPLTLVYTYTNATFLNSFDSSFGGWGEVLAGDEFPYLANHQFTVNLSLEHHKFNLNLSGNYRDEMRTAPGQGEINFDEKTDAYFVIDMSANYNLHKNLSFFANTTNLTNQQYIVARRPAGLRPNMPRAFNIGLKARF